MKLKFLMCMFAVFALFSTLSVAQAQEVEIGLYILNLGRFDITTGAFTADFYLSMRCDEPCSAENFEFMNGRAISMDKIIDTPTEKFYRIYANLNSQVDLKNFPFDSQKMQIIIEDKTNDINSIVYVPELKESGIDDSITFTGWKLDNWHAETREHHYEIYDETFSQYVFNINISRIFLNSFLKTFLPIFFIVMVNLVSFILAPDKITTRLAMAGSSLVAAVMFHVSINNQIPPVGYMTFADKFMTITYFILMISFIVNVLLISAQQQKKEKIVERIHKKTEYTMFFVASTLYLLLFVLFWLKII